MTGETLLILPMFLKEDLEWTEEMLRLTNLM